MNESAILQVMDQLILSRNPLVVCHMRPDGDAIGSLLGLGLALQASGKAVQMVSVDGVPAPYRFLKGCEAIVNKPRTQPDFLITVDCSDLLRPGVTGSVDRQPDVNIDHHITNTLFAKTNFVDPKAVATAEVLKSLIEHWQLPLTQDVASALLTGIVTDTLGFRTSNMTSRVLRQSAELMDKGADLVGIYQNTLIEKSFEAVSYWGTGLNKLQRNDGIAWTALTLADRAESSYPGRDDADLINVLSSIAGIDIAIVFVQQTKDSVKVSWRAKNGIDISEIALQFGGGGHPAAAGAELHGQLNDICQQVLTATQKTYHKELANQASNASMEI